MSDILKNSEARVVATDGAGIRALVVALARKRASGIFLTGQGAGGEIAAPLESAANLFRARRP